MALSNRNKLAVLLSLVSGLLFIFSGTSSFKMWKSIEEVVLSTINISLVKFIFSIILLTASLGGFAIIIGSWFLFKNYIRLGKLFILIGVGSGIISLLFHIFVTLSSTNMNFAWLFTTSSIAILLSIFARILAKKDFY
ncbi:MAG: hypothetical protein U9R00_02415 [Patescibacteria group bacterium]|nr:hypothetical protein [Patescibacteria group bacterium]